MTAIALHGLTKRYGDTLAVDGLDLTVEPGSLYGFLGPNGAGKTTTIRMMLGLVRPTAGRVRLLERDVFEPGREVLARVGAIVEEPAFWTYLSGRKNLEYLARSGRDGDGRAARVEEMLRRVDLHDAADKRVKAYSHGMRQRLGVAAALLGAPDILVLDEPTNGLDPQAIREMRVLLRRLADDGVTVFISSHLLGEVEATCDRVAVLAHGRLVAEGPPATLRGAATHVRIEVDDAAKAGEVLAKMKGVGIERAGGREIVVRVEEPATSATVNARLVRAGVKVAALVPERATLEDVFVKLVEGEERPR